MQIERRRFFRLDDQLLLAWKPLPAGMAEVRPRTLDAARELVDQEISSLIHQLRSTDPNMARLCELLNQKLNHLVLQHEDAPPPDMPEPQLFDVNLSACGMRFLTDDDLHGQTHLRLFLTLLPSHTPLNLIGRLVAVEDNPLWNNDNSMPRWLIRATFEPILDSDQEQLIQHMLRLQSRLLADRRNREEP